MPNTWQILGLPLVTYTATYTVVAVDPTGKDIDNTAVARAESPTHPVESNEASTKVPTVAPVIPIVTPSSAPSSPGKLPTTGSESLLMAGGVLALLVLVGGMSLRRSSEANVGFNRPEPYEASAQPASRARSF